jgi:GNAT superfamily N-acetyltransferase
MKTIEYHLATAADVAIIVDCKMLFSDELAGKLPPEADQTLRQILLEYFSREVNRNYICWYATVDGSVASIAGVVVRQGPGNISNPSGVWGYLMNVYTLPQYRKMGLSANVLDRLMSTAADRGITAFELHATEAGEALYVKAGFKLHSEPTYRKFISQAEIKA